MMLIIQNLAYNHPNKDLLFSNINFTLNTAGRTALIGNNGTGKSTLLKLIAGDLQPSAGVLKVALQPYYVPQVFGRFNDHTVGQALQVEKKLNALNEILAGNVSASNLSLLDDDWTIEARCQQALNDWEISDVGLSRKMNTLSGGQKTKVFLAGIFIHQPAFILMDEPTNHLDRLGRRLLYNFIGSYPGCVLVVSHDRKLLNMLDSVYELSRGGITGYGGNYDFYLEQKRVESNALNQDLRSKEKELRKAKDTERETVQRQQKLDARGKKKQEKAGLPTISMNTLRNNAEKSTARIKGVHSDKVGAISQELNELRKELPDADKMRFEFDDAELHRGKILFTADAINHEYNNCILWNNPLSFQIRSGERVAINGLNGSGKTTLMKIILGEIEPVSGSVLRTSTDAVYIDQDYSLIHDELSIYEQAEQFNRLALQEHEIKTRLNRFLFTKAFWNKPCISLSGGEKMRLMLCCLTIRHQAPDMIILDEPTNNLDVQNIEILTAAIREYSGTLIVVSHDAYFLDQVKVERVIDL